ncbi:hypothetical protein B0919_01780 [Hymenobacter sp. CRA2]|nr:hypothetical protein B0919_01780 [Hymenobacter sp. CRA2]
MLQARQQLRAARQRYQRRTLLSWLAVAAGLALGLAGAWLRWPAAGALLAGVGAAGVSLLVLALWPLRRLDDARVARQLDRHFPELEDSTGLLLETPTEFLPRLQQYRVAERLLALPTAEALPVAWRPRLVVACAAALLGLLCWRWPHSPAPQVAIQPYFPATSASAAPAAKLAARIVSTEVRVAPPAYTRQPAYAAQQLSFRCPEGALVRWTVHLNQAAAAPRLLLAGQPPVQFRPVAGSATAFVAEHRFTRSGLYRLQLADQSSDDYAVEVQPDRTPTVRLLAPRAYTLIEPHQRPEVAVRVALQDDYGLSRARLVVTTAQGSGEAVKFRESVTDLSAALRAQPRQHTATATLRLRALGLTYGDELYVYAETWDNAGHRARTDAALVQWADTAETEGIASISLGVNQMPAYFRSQRQIIIDTEKLIAERRKLSTAELQSRANSLGEDQKMLRLRYGKFLGEENTHGDEAAPRPPTAEDGDDHAEAGHDDHDHAPSPVAEDAASPTVESLMTPYQHLHDDSETADFLEPQVKTKLRAVLNQMWDAELRLRLAKLSEALPYEYRALRLLKEVQQQTRLYVRKSGVELPPLPEAEKRLTGDLSKAGAPRRQAQQPAPPTQPALRGALAQLALYRSGQRPAPADAARLQPAGLALGSAALSQPGATLPALRAWRRLLAQVRAQQPVAPTDLATVERALTALLPAPPATPQRPAATPLAKRYFQELSR